MRIHGPFSAIIITMFFNLLLLSTATEAKSVEQNVRQFSITNNDDWSSSSSSKGGHSTEGEAVTVMVDLTQSVNTISSRFIGITIDAGEILHNFSTLDFSSASVQNMAKALAPCYFRLGGTYADTMTYTLGNDNSNRQQQQQAKLGKDGWRGKVLPFNLTAPNWDAVNTFSQKAGWDFIMDLNALKRNADGSWNPENARQLLKYSAEKHYPIVGFELGNEYDVYKQTFNVTVSPQQLAKDLVVLQKLLSEFPQYETSFIIGPEPCCNGENYFEGFLASGGAKVVRAASFHQYYFAEVGSKLSDFISIARMNSLNDKVDLMLGWSRFVDPLLPVWLSETSSSYGGGTPNMSDRFVAGFLWLDKLGVCASKGIQTVIRQAFYGGHYSLISASLQPNPDFWLTVLYKRVVRGAVFQTFVADTSVRVYAACANSERFPAGSVVVYAMNPNPYPVTLNLPQFSQAEGQLLVYQLTAGDNLGLLSQQVSLNGIPLKLTNGTVPELTPLILSAPPVTMDTYSFVFVVIPTTRVEICRES